MDVEEFGVLGAASIKVNYTSSLLSDNHEADISAVGLINEDLSGNDDATSMTIVIEGDDE
jgi:hypothetical protein